MYLWQNERTVVIGKNQNSFKECQVDRLMAEGGHLARRLSGGGAVFHDLGNLNFTFCVRRDDYDVRRQLGVLIRALGKLGITARLSGRNDVTVDGRKVSGNAFYRNGDFCYHHGTILVDADMEMMGRYLNVSAQKLRSNGVSSVRSRVINLTDCVSPGKTVTVEMVRRAMLEAFAEIYGNGGSGRAAARAVTAADGSGRAESDTVDGGPGRAAATETAADAASGRPAVEAGLAVDACLLLELPEEAWAEIDRERQRFQDKDWLFGKRIHFTQEFSGKFSWGEILIRLRVVGDEIVEAQVYSDAMDQERITRLAKRLPGCAFHREALQGAIGAAMAAPEDGEAAAAGGVPDATAAKTPAPEPGKAAAVSEIDPGAPGPYEAAAREMQEDIWGLFYGK